MGNDCRYELYFVHSFVHDIIYSVTFYLQFYLCYYCIHTDYMHEHFPPFFYTLIRSFSDNPGFARSAWMFYFIDQVFTEIVRFVRSLKLPSVWSSLFIFSFILLIPYSLCTSLSYHLIPFLFSLLSCVNIYMCIAVIHFSRFIRVDFYNLFRLFKA